jgi:methylase of polypeptide subunit release factors
MSGDGLMRRAELYRLGRYLKETHYQFTAVTPDTHARVLARPDSPVKDARDVLGWNRPFEPGALPGPLFELLLSAEACVQLPDGRFRARLRCASVGELLFFHSAFPTSQRDAVFFGPDSYRFVHSLLQAVHEAGTVVDLGCGSGVGGIVLARSRQLASEPYLTDVNPRALELAEVNAELNAVRARVMQSDLLAAVPDPIDVVIANPPYLADEEGRLYRDGGAGLGSELSVRIVEQAASRLTARGGRLLLYSGAPWLAGEDQLLRALRPVLHDTHARFSYVELDPDIFGAELERPAYRDVERIAAVLLDARFAVR